MYVYIYVYIYMYVCAYVCMYVWIYIYIYTYIYTYTCIYIRIYIYMCVCMYVCMHVCMYMYVYVYIYMYVYIYILANWVGKMMIIRWNFGVPYFQTQMITGIPSGAIFRSWIQVDNCCTTPHVRNMCQTCGKQDHVSWTQTGYLGWCLFLGLFLKGSLYSQNRTLKSLILDSTNGPKHQPASTINPWSQLAIHPRS